MIKKPIIVAISGASGSIYAINLIKQLKENDIPVHLVISKNAAQTLEIETDYKIEDVMKLADCTYSNSDMAAKISSGSFLTAGMVVVPCSIKTLSSITYGITGNLIARAADVCLKEKRKLILVVRESPLHQGHLETMAKVASYGAMIVPPMPAFYTKPSSIDEVIDSTVAKILDILDVPHNIKRW